MSSVPEQGRARSGRFDAIVVGAGVGGCIVAARLAASGRRVLLADAGPGEPRPASVAGLDVVAASREPTRAWPGLTVRRTPRAAQRPYRQGRGLGGGSMINGMLLTPGDTTDYHRWGDRLGPEWGPEAMAPWLAEATAMFDGVSVDCGPISSAFEQAAADMGHPTGGLSTEPDRLGVVTARLAASAGRRRSAAEAAGVIDTASGRVADGIELVTGRTAVSIEMDGDRAIGVRWVDGSFTGAPKVVVCAGPIATPMLLAGSDLPATVNHAAIGRGLKDHPSVALTAIVRDSASGGAGPAVSRLLRWSSGPDEAGDLQAFVLEPVRTPDGTGPTMAVLVVGLMRVDSTGRVGMMEGRPRVEGRPDVEGRPRVEGRPDVEGRPRVEGRPDVVTGALVEADDRRRLRLGLRHLGRMLEAPAFDSVVERVVIDEQGTGAETLWPLGDDDLDRWMVDNPGPYAHPAATCPIGRPGARNAVVSGLSGEIGCVIGTEGLFVADSSILPDLVQGGLQLPVAAVAIRVADDLVRAQD